jgi:hypothetical protein
MLWPPQLQTVMMKFPFCVFHPVLLWFRGMAMMRFLFRAACILVCPLLPIPLCALVLPSRLVAMVNALLGMVYIDSLLLLHVIISTVIKHPFSIPIASLSTLT